MNNNPLIELSQLGQSIWLDDIHRGLLSSGELQRLIDEDAVSGVTSNPSILQKAISEHKEYANQIAALMPDQNRPESLYETLVLQDIRAAADLLRPVYEQSAGRDGFVSLEVSPHLADDCEATVTEARRLWSALDRPNAMIKVPATPAGLPAMSQLLAEGININATLIFGLHRYRQVAQAHREGLERRLANGGTLEGVASVASFFVSRIDTLVDGRLDSLAQEALDPNPHLQDLRGQAAVATARLAYQSCRQHLDSDAWQSLQKAGAQSQRLLWASTSTKDPAYSDVKYVEALIAPDSINTMPMQTLEAYREHGRSAIHIEDDIPGCEGVIERLAELGIDMEEVSGQLEREGVDKFITAYDELLSSVGELTKSLSSH